MPPCLICDRVSQWRNGKNPYFIHEFEYSIFVVGDHQFHPGYSLLLLKEHVRELHQLSSPVQTALFQELMIATNAIVQTFHPWKMNHACYGNAEPHIHWHLFPRYSDDPDRYTNPWLHSAQFSSRSIDPQTARTLSRQIRANLNP
jgi:diadenosine tetraphosphate (Ap4A) HIT family hydrolase